jgi:hypothetical protein
MHEFSKEAFPPILERVLTRLDKVQKAPKGWMACCPSHDDRTFSLSISLGNEGQVLLHCFAGCPFESIVEASGLQVSDLFPGDLTPPSGQKKTATNTLSLLDLAQTKKIPWKFLCNLGVVEEARGLRIPYYTLDGKVAPRYRIRTALSAKEGSWWNKAPGDILPYGLERLEEARKAGFLVLVEGESDCWTLWLQRFPALGLPGAEMANKLQVDYLAGIERLYVFREPDAAGTRFVEDLARLLTTWGWPGAAWVVSLPDAKDPNELHQQDWQGFRAAFQQALDHAQPLYRLEPAASTSEPVGTILMTLEELLAEPYEKSHWTIPELLPEGLILLGGKPKQGKSWLALTLALTVASGGAIFETYQATNGGEVLFLGLEDTERRLQTRSKQLLTALPTVPAGITFATQWPRLDEGGLTHLEAYIQAHPHLRCIVIDTWARVAPRTKGRTQYEEDYASLSLLKGLADAHHLSLLVIHHLRKTQAHDVLDEMMGSTAMIGAVDAILILKRERGEGQAALFVTGRDIEHEHTLAIRFHQETGWWQIDDSKEQDQEEEASSPNEQKRSKKHA